MATSKKEKWQTLEHNGPVFPAKYEPKGYFIYVNSKPYELSPQAEELAYAWAQKHATDYVKDPVFQKNFWEDFSKLIPEELKSTSFPSDWDFHEIEHDIEITKEKKKQKTKEDRKKEKEEREARKEKYGFALLNGQRVELGNYTVEPPGIFMGRGEHPLRGRWKPRIYPSDVTINVSQGSKVPDSPAGTEWGSVVENKNALWTAMWYEKLTGSQKRVLFSVNSFVRQQNDIKKFQKAIELSNNYDKVMDFIERKLASRDKLTRELATVCELIAKMSIRVGDEKGEDTADTVGASTLRVEHIKIEDDNSVAFDFLGKDSIRYYNKVYDLDINAVRNLKEFIKGKKKRDMVFDHITSRDVNEFLGLALDGLTAKQFRTASGSVLLAESLKKKKIDPNLKDNKKLEYFTEANLDVAVKLNHQSAVSEAYEKSLDNMKEKVKELKKELKKVQKEAEDEIARAKETRDARVSFAKNRYTGSKQKESMARARKTFRNKKERLDKRVARLKERIENYKTKIKIKEKTKGIALGTSKLNYADPRIPISWAKDHDVEVKRIYPPTAQKKFEWALDVDKDFYKKYPKV